MRNLEDMKKSDNIMSSDAKEGTENIPDIDKVISELVNYASENELIEADDKIFIVNRLLDIFEKNGLAEEPEAFYEKARFSYESSYQAMNRLLDRNLNITAVFAMSDVMAVGAVRAIRDRGLQVPEDISIIGFDGIPLANYYNPKLATVKQQYQILAVRSVEILLGAIDLKKPAVHEIIPFELVAGESVKQI